MPSELFRLPPASGLCCTVSSSGQGFAGLVLLTQDSAQWLATVPCPCNEHFPNLHPSSPVVTIAVLIHTLLVLLKYFSSHQPPLKNLKKSNVKGSFFITAVSGKPISRAINRRQLLKQMPQNKAVRRNLSKCLALQKVPGLGRGRSLFAKQGQVL